MQSNYTNKLIMAGMPKSEAGRLGQTIEAFIIIGERHALEDLMDAAFKRYEAHGKIALQILRIEQEAETERKHRIATRLIEAVQSEDLQRLAVEVSRVKAIQAKETAGELARTGCLALGLIDAELANTGGLTALHVACGNYKLHPEKANTFDAMAGMLLEAGASAIKPVGERKEHVKRNGIGIVRTVDPGRTIAEVCLGRVPPSVTAWVAGHSELAEQSKVQVA